MSITRDVRPDDFPAVAAIYGHHVVSGFGSFEEAAPSAAEMARRAEGVLALGLPYLVAQSDAGVIGFAYASAFRPRPAYRYTAEDSVYVAPEAIGRGVGRALLQAVIDRCQARGLRQLMAIIGDSGNQASIGLHRALGFEILGVGRSIGFKRGRWLDIVWMQRALLDGDGSRPAGGGLTLSGG
ncbi:MAG TPA: GNAT family N-acetyltransferase [Caulobacteraceae bacterium]|nr:GNAT family N-acetyltransferase [Caulobacteraceae bacterium]